MKYDTKNVYFGCVTYNVSKGNVWKTNPEPFLKEEDKYIRINLKNANELIEYKSDSDKYVTVSDLYPLTNMMEDKEEIPEKIGGLLINLYLIKYRMQKHKQTSYADGYPKGNKSK